MVGTALIALIANAACVVLLARHRNAGVHMRARWIFSTTNVIAKMGVILAGALVHWTEAFWPALIVGAVVALLVVRGAMQILSRGRSSLLRPARRGGGPAVAIAVTLDI